MGGYLSNKIGEDIPPDQEAILAQIANLGTPGQILAVNALGTGVEWIDAPTGGGLSFETPVGTIDGSNRVFIVSNTPLYIVLNGSTYFENDGYTLSGLTITIISALTPQTGSTLRSAYA